MKNYFNKALVALCALAIASQAQAYTYSFTNHTNKPIALAQKLNGINEPLSARIAQPHTRVQFRPGDPDIRSDKAGYVVKEFYYSQIMPKEGSFTVTLESIYNHPWRAMPITWVPSASYDIAIELAESLGNTGEAAGKAGLKAGAAYATGGASVIADEAKKALKGAKGEALSGAAGGEYGLGALLKSVGKAIGHSMARSRHIDIVEDEDGKLSFITLL
jgi:hypothetical protein